jgi:hypothetical protein
MMSYVTHLLQPDPPSKISRGSSAYDNNRQQADKFPQRLSHRPTQSRQIRARHDGCQRAIEIQK